MKTLEEKIDKLREIGNSIRFRIYRSGISERVIKELMEDLRKNATKIYRLEAKLRIEKANIATGS